MKLKIDIEKITVDHDVQVRESTNTDVINDYANDFDKLPPIDVFYDGEKYWLSDGFHRIAAGRKVGAKTMLCEVREGGKREAILHALTANGKHGLRLSNACKRRSVELMLNDPEWSEWSNRRIADYINVSHDLVRRLRDERKPQVTLNVTSDNQVYTVDTSEPVVRKGKDGKEYTVPARKEKEPEPEIQPATEPEVYDVWEEVEPPEPKESKVDQFRKLRSLVKQHANQMIRAVDDMQSLRCNPGTHKELLGLFEQIHSLVDGWPE